MRKFLERLETDDKKELLETLFKELCDNIISRVSCTVYYPTKTPKYDITLFLDKIFANDTFDDFNKLFLFLKKMNVIFSLSGNQLIIIIVDVDNFIDEMKMIISSKKYNII